MDDPYPTEVSGPLHPWAAQRNGPTSMFLPSNAARLARKQPRRPDFLLEPLGYGTLQEQG